MALKRAHETDIEHSWGKEVNRKQKASKRASRASSDNSQIKPKQRRPEELTAKFIDIEHSWGKEVDRKQKASKRVSRASSDNSQIKHKQRRPEELTAKFKAKIGFFIFVPVVIDCC